MNNNNKNSKDINSMLKKGKDLKKKETGAKDLNVSILFVLLLIFIGYLVTGVIINSFKIYSLNSQIAKLNKINKVATKKNQYLREELEKYTSNSGVEALARNRLQFTKEDETLIIIKNNNSEDNFE